MKKALTKKLTLEDFKRLAVQGPDLDGQYIYCLVRYMISHPQCTDQYPRFHVYEDKEIFCLSFAEAEEKIRALVEEPDADEVYCFRIEQIPSGGESHWHGVYWLYDAHGKLLDYTTARWASRKEAAPFYGRPTERHRFKRGDIVEVMVPGDEVHLALYLGGPDTPEECFESFQKDGYISDASDDTASLLSGGHRLRTHENSSTVRLMKPRWPIPADIETEMKSWLLKEYPDEPYFDWPHRKVLRHGVSLDQIGMLELIIHYDESTPVPHLHIDDGYGFRTCLRIDRAEYYAEDGEQPAELSPSQKEALMDYFETAEYDRTNWWYLLRDYNNFHLTEAKYRLPLDTPLPDFRKLK